MTEKSLVDRYKELAAKPVVTNPGGECIASLEAIGMNARIYPTYDNVLAFFKEVNRKASRMDKKDIACVRKQIMLMSKNATDPVTKKVIRDGRGNVNKMLDGQLKRLDGKKHGTTLSMGVPRKFDELR